MPMGEGERGRNTVSSFPRIQTDNTRRKRSRVRDGASVHLEEAGKQKLNLPHHPLVV